ncbi:hypothetical protein DB30_02132 [Enhygromyxa salina]|uniref:DUF1697 domain-containing protein n=1 Tax=Enhygromyxa salina TaxID=215803 RepID=A0A0C1Z348_9BACT|nr:DUF1697 domain-containing protein [Enhygromyxa salina]KIG12014.1 hypothetical protein DB30_02132 [Enhygromyxa salina]
MAGRPKSTRHIALLRGINVGGKNRLPMATLRGLFTDVGAAEVTTYIQSGNVVFSAPAKLAKQIAGEVRESITRELGLEIPLVVRSAPAFAKVAREHPFVDAVPEPKFAMVGFCDHEPSATKVAALDPNRSPGDLLEVRGAEVYLAFPNGSGRSKFTAAWLDRSLGVISTWRNWLTVQKLVELI